MIRRGGPATRAMEKLQKFVLQYPPGTGAALALFPEGFQVISLYVTANVIVLAFALVALMRASTPHSLTLAAIFGLAALYLMINATKASYSIAPTMMVCGPPACSQRSCFRPPHRADACGWRSRSGC